MSAKQTVRVKRTRRFTRKYVGKKKKKGVRAMCLYCGRYF